MMMVYYLRFIPWVVFYGRERTQIVMMVMIYYDFRYKKRKIRSRLSILPPPGCEALAIGF